MEKITFEENNSIETCITNFDEKIIHSLKEAISQFSNELKTIALTYSEEIHIYSLDLEMNLSALDYLMSKTKELFLHTLLIELTMLEDNKSINKLSFKSTDRFTVDLISDTTTKKASKLSKADISDIKSAKYDFLKEEFPDEFDKFRPLFQRYQKTLFSIGHAKLNDYETKSRPYNIFGTFIDNINYIHNPISFIKKDFSLLYTESEKYTSKINKKSGKYINKFPISNFYYLAFLITEFDNKSSVFSKPAIFFNYIGKHASKSLKYPSQIHEKNNRDFNSMISRYNKHVKSANEYKNKLINNIHKHQKKDPLKDHSYKLLNYHYLVNTVLRTDFFSSLDSPMIKDVIKRISITDLYSNLCDYTKTADNENLRPYSISSCIVNNPNLENNAKDLFYLNLLELLMLFNIDTLKLSNLCLFVPTQAQDINISNNTYLSDFSEIYRIAQKVIFNFLDKSLSIILSSSKEVIDLYNKMNADNTPTNCLLQTIVYNLLSPQYDFDDLDNISKYSGDFKSISDETINIYHETSPKKQLVICYLFNSCARNRILLDYFYKLDTNF